MTGKYRIVRLLLFWTLALSITIKHGGASSVVPEEWDRNFINSGGTTESPRVRIELTYLSYRQHHLTGQFHVGNLSGAPVRVDGTETVDGKFWPDAVMEVASGDNKTDWNLKKIGSSSITGRRATVSIAQNVFSDALYVNLDAFTSAIGKFTYGRIVLADGSWSMFELNDLQPKRK